MGLFKQLMIFGETGLQGLPTRVTLSLWAFSRQGATGVPLFTTWDPVAGSGRAPIPGNISGRSPGSILSHLGLGPPRDRDLGKLDLSSAGVWERDYGWGSGYAAILARLGDLKESWFILFSN